MNLRLEFEVVCISLVLLCGNRCRKVIAKDFVYSLNYRLRIGEEKIVKR
jgi:hypothetical protein